MAADATDHESLDQLLNELDLRAQQQDLGESAESYWVCQRSHPRRPFRTTCKVHFFPLGSSSLGCLKGRTRNLSRSGVGLLIRRMFAVGDPLEVEITIPGHPVMYVAGLVTFCRYAGQGYHEVGIALRTASGEPVFSKDPQLALEAIDWLREARATV